MEYCEAEHGCKKHSNHQEKQGVCPSCLRERLSCLTLSYKEASRVTSSLYFCPAHYSLASNPDSPARHSHSHMRNSSGVMGIMGMSSSSGVKLGASNGLKKSRSIAFVPRNLDEDDEETKKGKKKKGFWSKLVHFKGKKDAFNKYEINDWKSELVS
ncbi:uncharacterized protein LOC108483255 [Gossypium arboreum]|uniref:Uncharacterized protein n=1 Tax=Gossypium arboreum TaxID=29729 RepID=A0ABR0N4I7_GOSAR|nr:uncharacterized protein LOC108483255 [Gossypium arboreum]KAK5785252.1 hypothetical protein PVK06_039819 [Gossypium arboreum]